MDKKKTIILNTNMVKCFSRRDGSYGNMTSKFDNFTLAQRVSGNPFVHAIIFNSKNSRDKAINLLKEWKTENKIEFPFFYKGEKVTQDMLDELLSNNGNFSSWEKYEELY